MNHKLISVLMIPLVTAGCVNVKSVRDDGVYKQYKDKGYTYYSFSKKPKVVFSYSCNECDDAEAFEKLEQKKKNPERYGEGYNNEGKYISTYGENGRMHWDGKINKNRNGEIENSVFLQKKNNMIVKVADYRIEDSYHLLTWDGVDALGDGYDDIYLYEGRYARVRKNHKYGVYDVKNGSFVLPVEYSWIELGAGELMPLSKNGMIGFYDKKFRIKIKPQFSDAHKLEHFEKKYFIDGIQAVRQPNTKWFFIDESGRRITKLEVEKVGDYLSREFVPVITDGSNVYKYVDLVNGRSYKLHSYGATEYNGYLTHYLGGSKYILTTAKGAPVFKSLFESVFSFRLANGKDVFIVKKFGKSGVIDLAGNELVPLEFNVVELVVGDDGKAIAFKAGMGGNITNRVNGVFALDGKLIVPVEFGQIEHVGDGFYIARKTVSGYKRISASLYKSGNPDPVFEAGDIIKFKTSELLSFEKAGKYGIVDLAGRVVVEPKYHYIDGIKGNLFADYVSGDGYIYNFKGEELRDSDNRFKFYNKFYYDADARATFDYDFKKLIDTDSAMISTCDNEHFVVSNGDEKGFYKYDGSVVVKGYQSITCYFNGRPERYIMVKREVK